MNRPHNCLLVVHKGDHSLGYYDLNSGREMKRVALDPFPHEFALSPDRRYAYMCHFGVALAEDAGVGGNTVSVVDVQRQERIGTLSCGEHRRPHGIDLDAKGRVYVVSEADSRLLRFDPADGVAPEHDFPTGGHGSHWVSVRRDGKQAFCSNMGSGTVTAISLGGEAEPVVIPVGERPEGSVLSGDESRLYVVNRESASISVIDTRALASLEPIRTRRGPVRICLAGDGKLLVALYHETGLVMIDPEHPDDETYLELPGKAISINHDQASGLITLSILGDQVCVVDAESFSLTRCIQTLADPDPTALIALDLA